MRRSSGRRVRAPRRAAVNAAFAVMLLAAPAAAVWEISDVGRPGQLTIYNRTARGADLGFPLAAGDLNGDGRDDLVLTPMHATPPDFTGGPAPVARESAGEAVLLFSDGTIGGIRDLALLDPAALPADVILVYGADAHDNLGTEVVVADVDGDGYGDALIGAQYGDGVDNARADAGEVVIIWGPAQPGGRIIDLAAPPPDVATVIVGANPGDRLGVWVSAGDIDGDGVQDAILGADQVDGPAGDRPHAGATYVVYGGPALRRATIDLAAPPVPVTVVHGIDPEDHSGATVRGADLDRDGVGDLLIGAGLNRLSASSDPVGRFNGHGSAGGDGPDNQCDPVSLGCITGEAYVVYGVRSARPPAIDLRTPPADTTIVYGIDAGDAWGEELFAGDFDGDGQGDLAIGALTADGPDHTRSNAGELALIRGGPAGLRGQTIDLAAPPAGVTMVFGARAGAIAGDTALLLDLDGDGRDELVVAAPTDAAPGRTPGGRVYVLFGSPTLPPAIDLLAIPETVPHLIIEAVSGGDQLAYSMSLGDVNGDGLRDLVLNAMGADGYLDLLDTAGDAYVLDAVEVSRAAGRDVITPTPPAATPTAIVPTPTATVDPPPCTGDCDGDGAVVIAELVRAVAIALGEPSPEPCAAADGDGDGTVAIHELIAAVTRALLGCSGSDG